MKEELLKINYAVFETTYYADCDNCSYIGGPRNTKREAAIDVHEHKVQKPNHIVKIYGHQTRKGKTIVADAELKTYLGL